VQVTQQISNLTPNTTYHFRMVGQNSGGTATGTDLTCFIPAAQNPPIVATTAFSSITGTSVFLNGTVNPNGAPATGWFEWGTSLSYGNSTAPLSGGSGTTPVPLTVSVSGLLPNTLYYYRAVGNNGAGTNYGQDVTFTTAPSSQILGFDTNFAIDWQAASEAGKQFAYLKATEGSLYPLDPNLYSFPYNRDNAKQKHIVVGAYHFATPLFSAGYHQGDYDHLEGPGLIDSAKAEANHFVDVAQSVIGPGFLPPALDVEDQFVNYQTGECVDLLTGHSYYTCGAYHHDLPSRPPMSVADLVTWVQTWVDTVRNRTGVTPIVYPGLGYQSKYDEKLAPSLGSEVNLWVVQWNNMPGSPHSVGNPAWPWIFHQYSKALPIGSKYVLGDAFNGTLDDFNALLNGSSGPTISSVAPSFGSIAGGTTITITGTNLTGVTGVSFGSAPGGAVLSARAFAPSGPSGTQITAVSPANGASTVHVTVATSNGTSAISSGDLFTFGAPPPSVTAVSPNNGPPTGSTGVVIAGINLLGVSSVMFGSVAATSFAVDNANEITAISPPGAGAVDVTVTTPGGTTSTSLADLFTYGTPAPIVLAAAPVAGSTAGGDTVTITGANFTGASAVAFGSAASTNFSVVNSTMITAVTPTHTAGDVNVTVATAGGTSTNNVPYTYVAAPTVSGVSPNSGPASGGTSAVITGTNFDDATAVSFGGAAATFNVVDSTTINATTPAHAAGAVEVSVTTTGGIGAGAHAFSYIGATTVSLTSSPNPSLSGQSVAFTATVTSGGGTPTGTVTFMDGGSTLGAQSLSGGVAVFSTAVLSVGSHSVTAVYSGDGSFAPSTSSPLIQTVTPSTYTVTLSASPNSGGSVSGGGTFSAGSSRNVTASTKPGYAFANWTENGSVVSTAQSYTFTLNSDRNLVANFTGGPSPATYVDAQAGLDSGSCLVTAPCATLNYALSVTNAGGLITIVKGGTFGPVVITQAVTIDGPADQTAQILANPPAQPGCVGALPAACALTNHGYAVEIAAGAADAVELNNLVMDASIDGAGALKLTSGNLVRLSNTVLHGNDTDASPILWVNPSSAAQMQVHISYTEIAFSKNGGAALVNPTGSSNVKLLLDHLQVHNAAFGFKTDATGLTNGNSVVALVSDSEFFSFAGSAVTALSVAGSGIVNGTYSAVDALNTTGPAIDADGPNSTLILTNGTLTGNQAGVAVVNGATVYTSLNNTIKGNGVDLGGVITDNPRK
jgi:GH25 family lysozyme M1 (1,4-beta-N-acetylmuramidase)